MKIIRIALTPLEPYFFGNDKNLKYVDGDAKKTKAATYYAVSEKTPSQSTLFGVLRYLGLSKKNMDYSISEEEKKNIGGRSFQLLQNNEHGFGNIIRISNLFLMGDSSEEGEHPDYYIPMPLDHNVCGGESLCYQPFPMGYFQKVCTSQGERMLPIEYKVKSGFADGYVNLTNAAYVKDEDIFKKVETVGIQVNKEVDGYFKRVRYRLEKGYTLAFFAHVEDDFYLSDDRVVYMGYGKSTFKVKTHELASGVQLPSSKLLIKEPILSDCTKRVALSDIYVKDPLTKLYQCCAYVNVRSREHREFFTYYGSRTQQKRFERGTHYIHLIKAGSVFYVNNKELETFDGMIKDENAEIAGFNQMTGDERG